MPLIIGRKKKDTAGIADVASGKSKSYVTVSRRSVNPMTGSKIKKGSMVTATPSKKIIGFAQLPSKASISSTPGSVRVTSSYKPADYNGGKINMRATTPDHANSGESPAKVAIRMGAQSAGKESYAHPTTGKPELAGIRTDVTKITPGKVSVITKTKPVAIMGNTTRLNVHTPASGGSPNLKKRAITLGGSVGERPANKYGIGGKGKVTVVRRKVF